MLKVVGASWLQTRISTYILVAVGLLGFGVFLLGEFGSNENDGTYSATAFWNHKGGYRIDFWGQGNDLASLPKGAARAYYKPKIQETGWSIIEIESNPSYPDMVQAYAAGFLEGSLTWQLIHHHWHNTIETFCSQEENVIECDDIRQKLSTNAAVVRERANVLSTEDPFWHMVRLFYAQLDGMEAGWKFAVHRSRRSVEIKSEDFLWLAMASDVTSSFFKNETDYNDEQESLFGIKNKGVILVKSLNRTMGLDPIIAIAHNTVAPYAKMLRLLKRYTFGYHLAGNRHTPHIPTRSILMSSYPGALSSHDEYYVVRGGKENGDTLILAGVPLRDSLETKISKSVKENDKLSQEIKEEKEYTASIRGVMSSVRIMSASRLTMDPQAWSRYLARGIAPGEVGKVSQSLQWVTVSPKDSAIWLIEQRPSVIRAFDYTKNFTKKRFLLCDGAPILEKSVSAEKLEEKNHHVESIESQNVKNLEFYRFFVENLTTVESIRNFMRGNMKYFDAKVIEERTNESTILPYGNIESLPTHYPGTFIYRGDLESPPKPIGTIDNKMTLVTSNSMEGFEAVSGPPYSLEVSEVPTVSFDWNKSFPNISHIGQPDKFKFETVIPEWIWF